MGRLPVCLRERGFGRLEDGRGDGTVVCAANRLARSIGWRMDVRTDQRIFVQHGGSLAGECLHKFAHRVPSVLSGSEIGEKKTPTKTSTIDVSD